LTLPLYTIILWNNNPHLVLFSNAFGEGVKFMKKIVLALLTLFVLIGANLSWGFVIHIPADYATIQAGINSSVDGDTVLVSPGIYNENIHLVNKSIAIISESGPETATINSATQHLPVVSVRGAIDYFEISGFTISNAIQIVRGGGISVTNSSAIIRNNIIVSNHSTGGGGISIDSCSEVKIFDNFVRNNTGTDYGGGIQCTQSSNTEIYGNEISNNSSDSGGGIYFEHGSNNYIHHNVIFGNAAVTKGGGICCACNALIENNTIVGNTAGIIEAGGVEFKDHPAQLINNIIASNSEYGVRVDNTSAFALYNDVWNNSRYSYLGVVPGVGSITLDPRFVNEDDNDFRLFYGSPCINTGNPDNPLDPDGSISDIGAVYPPYGGPFTVITGTVSDSYNNRISGVIVTTYDGMAVDTTNTQGYFGFGLFPYRGYDISFTRHGYLDTVLTNVLGPENDTAFLDIRLTTSPEPGNLRGYVDRIYLGRISGAIVTLDNLGMSDTSNGRGEYFFSGIPPGPQNVTFTYPCHEPHIVSNFLIPSVDTAVLNARLTFHQEGFYGMYGGRDGSPVPAVIGEKLAIPTWGATNPYDLVDSVVYINMLLSSRNDIIVSRDAIFYPDTLMGRWDELPRINPFPDTTPGWTVDQLLGFAYIQDPPNPENFFFTRGDTALIGWFTMHVANDSSLLGDTICPFKEGYTPIEQGQFWGMADGMVRIFPPTTYSSLYFLGLSEVGYISGNLSWQYSGPIPGAKVKIIDDYKIDSTDAAGNYLLGWLTQGSYVIRIYKTGIIDTTIAGIEINGGDTAIFNIIIPQSPPNDSCVYIPGDINGNGTSNGIDVTYGVSYFKGGAVPPISCSMCPEAQPFYAGGDVNGSCVFNGIDITYFVGYLKGINPALLHCADCPPAIPISK
jgi:hypothetical protein